MRSRVSGTTLPEILLAIGILAVGLLALVGVQSYTAKARLLNQNHVFAAQRAASEVARLSELARADFEADLTRKPQALRSVTDQALEDRMTLTAEVQENWDGSPTLKALTVTVTYPSQGRDKGGRVRVWTLLRK